MWGGGGGGGRTFKKSMCEVVRFIDIFEYLLHQCNKEDMDLFAITAKSIWNKRNTIVHRGDFSHPNYVAKEGGILTQQFCLN